MRARLLTALLLMAACTDDVTLAPSRPYIPQPTSVTGPQGGAAGTAAQQESAALNRALSGDRYNPGAGAGRGATGPAYDPDDIGAMGTLPVEQAPPGFGGL